MHITETSAEGLKREFKIVVPAKDIEEKVNSRLREIGHNVRLPGFRPGKVPMPLLKQRYGKSVMGEVLEQAVNDSSRQALSERGLRPALQPKIEVTAFAEGADLEYSMAVEVLPEIEPMDFSTLEVEKPVVQVAEAKVEEALNRLAESQKPTAPVAEPRPARSGDTVVIDFSGTVDGVAHPGMASQDYHLVLGGNTFIPGFEDQLVGTQPGEHRTVTVTFPQDYGNAELAGKEAVFEVDVKELREPKPVELNDELAKTFGFDDLEALRNAVRERLQQDYNRLARQHLKRQLLDKLAAAHHFPVPAGMVEMEFEAIWRRVEEERKAGRVPEEDAGKSEEELKGEYRAIAERRVRLGLLLSEVGRRNNIQVTQDELSRAVISEVQRFPGQERQVFDFFQKHPEAVDSLRAPIFEEKVIDYILELAQVQEKQVTPDELARMAEQADGDTA